MEERFRVQRVHLHPEPPASLEVAPTEGPDPLEHEACWCEESKQKPRAVACLQEPFPQEDEEQART